RPLMGSLGNFVGKGSSGGLFGMLEQAKKAARKHYVAELPPEKPGGPRRYATRLDVVLKTDPVAAGSAVTLRLLQAWLHGALPRSALVPGLTAECYGVTVNAQDL